MAKTAITGWLHEPLTAVVGTRAKLAALRILWRATGPLPYREVTRRSGMAYRSIDLALRDLVAIGLVERIEGGRERLVRLRSGHRLAAGVGALLQVEADFFPALRVELRATADRGKTQGLLAVAIVGASAVRKESLDGATDLLIVAADKPAADRWLDRYRTLGEGLELRFGTRLAPVAYDLATARAMWNRRTPAAERSVREAEMVFGEGLEVLLAG